MLAWPASLWLTGSSEVSSGQMPCCSSASTSVPTPPASSGLTVSQLLVLKPGSEIWPPPSPAPVPEVHCVVAAVLCTCQPPRPIVDVPDGLALAGALATLPVTLAAGAAVAAEAMAGTPRAARLSTKNMLPAMRNLADMQPP